MFASSSTTAPRRSPHILQLLVLLALLCLWLVKWGVSDTTVSKVPLTFTDERNSCAKTAMNMIQTSIAEASMSKQTLGKEASEIIQDEDAAAVQAEYEKIIRTGFIDVHYAIAHGIYPRFLDAYPEAQTIFEGGAGACQLIAALTCLGKKAYGVEISPHLVNTACHSFVKAGTVKQGSLAAIPFPKDHFDLVFSSEVLEHVPEMYHKDSIKELVRVSKGRLYITISSRRSVHDPEPPAPATIHVSVMPREYWVNQFAARCCYLNETIVNNFHYKQRETYAFECVKPCNPT